MFKKLFSLLKILLLSAFVVIAINAKNDISYKDEITVYWDFQLVNEIGKL